MTSGKADQFHRGPCADCGREMVSQQAWWSDESHRRRGRVKIGGWGRCQACYMRVKRSGWAPPVVEVVTSYCVRCATCGPVGDACSGAEARRLRRGHLEQRHGVPSADGQKEPLVDAELARLRRAVGLVS